MLVLTLVLGASQADTVALGPRLSLEAVVARTLAYSPGVAGARGALRDASAARRVALGAYLPSLSLNSSGGWSDQTSVSSLSPASATSSYGAGLATSIDLFTGGRRGAQRSAAASYTRAADAGWVFARYAAMLAAKQGYFAVLRARELVRVADEFVAATELGLTYATDRETTGTATRSDVLRARLALAAARRQWLAAQDTLAMAGAALGRLVGADGPVDAEPAATLDATPLALSDSALRALAPAVAPGVVAAEAQAAVDAAIVREAKSLYLPTIAVGAGYTWANGSRVSTATRPGWAVALTTSFPLFNGFVREAAVTQAEAIAEVATVVSADAKRLTRAEAQRLLGSLHVAEQDIALTRASVGLAREDLRVIQARYRSGIATILDVLASQTALVQSELDLVSAQFTYQVARASLEALLGRDL
jgi:outer membrane protein TolC